MTARIQTRPTHALTKAAWETSINAKLAYTTVLCSEDVFEV